MPESLHLFHDPGVALDGCARRDPGTAGNPAQDVSEDSIMSTSTDLSFVSHDQLFGHSLFLETLHAQAPAVFAPWADGERSARYTFIPSARVLEARVEALQARTRSASELHVRHVIRLRRRLETVRLRVGLFRALPRSNANGTFAIPSMSPTSRDSPRRSAGWTPGRATTACTLWWLATPVTSPRRWISRAIIAWGWW